MIGRCAAAWLFLLAATAQAQAQPGDAGVPTVPIDAAVALVPLTPTESIDQSSLEARELELARQTADRDRREALAARERALADQMRARSEAELVLTTARAELEAIRARQAEFQGWLVRQQSALVDTARRYREQALELDRAERAGGDVDPLYDRVTALLAVARVAAMSDVGSLFHAELRPPHPDAALHADITALQGDYPAKIAELEALRSRLAARATTLHAESRQGARERVSLLLATTDRLSQRRLRLFQRISGDKRDRLRGFTAETAMELRGEAMQVVLDAAFWFHTRLRQLKALPETEVSTLGQPALSALWILVLLLVLRSAIRRWDGWMRGAIEAVGRTAHMGGWTLLFARLAELARGFGPALLVLVVASVIYARLEGPAAPPEVRIAFVLVSWTALFRFQLRLVEGLSRQVGNWASERARQRQETLDDAQSTRAIAGGAEGDGTTAPAGTEPANTDPLSSRANPPAPVASADIISFEPLEVDAPATEPAWSLFARSWRVATRYVAVVVILLALTELAVGAGVFHGLVARLSWWGAVVLLVYFLWLWGPRVVKAYLDRAPADGVLAGITRRHAGRFYGLVVVAIALAVVLVRRAIELVRTSLSGRDATKRLFAFLFRRRVEKHAQKLGWVLDQPHELPAAILEQSPQGALGPEHRPVKPALVDEIVAIHERWLATGSDGSVAVVGAGGMGKSTALRMLPRVVPGTVIVGALTCKITRPEKLYGWLAEVLGIADPPTVESQLIERIRAGERQVVVLDDCHNLFLRRVGGFDAWEVFTRVVNETCDHVMWIAGFNDIAWEYLSDIADGVVYFRRVLVMPAWSDEELRWLMLTRIRRAGYRPSFTDLLVTRLEGVKLSTQIIGTAQAYFRMLWDFTDGNPRDASHFWLRSLVPDPERLRVRVHLFAAPRVEELHKLPDDVVFVLAAVVEHEEVNVGELATITNMTPEFCRFALRFCREAGYVWRDPDTGRSHLAIHWRQTIIRFLRRRHLLYS